MPVVRSADNPTFDLQGNTIDGLAAPRSGCTETIMYRLTVPPGAETPAHSHDHEEVFHLAAGSLKTRLDDDAHDVRSGDTVIIPPGVRHSVRSTGPGAAALLCVMPAGTLFVKPDGSGAVPPWGE
ncbi:MAG: cupin domain-containing protein [Actinomycetota bacterium]|nr:cupin domain-containing protein [Actinomycetota bacterium]